MCLFWAMAAPGAVVAISAHDAGARVIVVEKDEGGGNTRLATLTFLCPVAGAAASEHIKALSFDTIEDEAIERYVEWTSTNVDFIGELGGEVQLVLPELHFPFFRDLRRCFVIVSKATPANLAEHRSGRFFRRMLRKEIFR